MAKAPWKLSSKKILLFGVWYATIAEIQDKGCVVSFNVGLNQYENVDFEHELIKLPYEVKYGTEVRVVLYWDSQRRRMCSGVWPTFVHWSESLMNAAEELLATGGGQCQPTS